MCRASLLYSRLMRGFLRRPLSKFDRVNTGRVNAPTRPAGSFSLDGIPLAKGSGHYRLGYALAVGTGLDGDSRDRRPVRCGAGGYHYRATPQSPANDDTFTVWSVSLTSHVVAPLLKGVNLRWLDRMHFAPARRGAGHALRQLPRLRGANLLHILSLRPSHHMWAARWLRGGGGAGVERQPAAERAWTQVYTAMADPDGRELVGTWNHIDLRKPEAARGLCLPLRS